jgi:hypothetical protein
MTTYLYAYNVYIYIYTHAYTQTHNDQTRVEAGSNTPTITTRVVGGDEKESLKSEAVKYGRKSQGARTDEDCAAKGQRHIQITDPSSRQRGRPTESRTCQTYYIFRTEKKSGPKLRMGALYQDRLAD